MEQILALVLTILISAGASWIQKRWKEHKRHAEQRQPYAPARAPYRPQPAPPGLPPIIMAPENEGGSITQLRPQQVDTPNIPPAPEVPPMADINADEAEESSQRLARWRQAIIDSEILSPRHF